MDMSYVHLYINSAYTLLSSTIQPERLPLYARKYGYEAIALTDRNVLYGVIPFYKACHKAGIKPIIGMVGDIGTDNGIFPLLLLAKNEKGYKNMLKISSIIQRGEQRQIPEEELRNYASDLFAITPGMEGDIEQLLLADRWEKAKERIHAYRSIFDDHSFYLSLQHYATQTSRDLFGKMVRLSKETGTPLVATNKICFLDKEDMFSWKCLLAIRENKNVEEIETEKEAGEYYFKTVREMESLFSEMPEALVNAGKIAEAINVEIPFHQQLLPKFPLKGGLDSNLYLEELCYRGLKARFGEIPEQYRTRLQYELSVIKNMNFSDYFLIVADYVTYAKSQGITVGPGRGSAAGSLVAYALGITDVDPIQFDLLFERFLNPERVSMPDIDIDFPDHRRDEVISYVARKYGEDRVAQIITFGTFQAKAALRDIARVFGLSSKELEQLSRAIPSRLGITLEEAERESQALQKLLENERYLRIFQIAKKIEGLPRHTSTHAAGVVIGDRDLSEMIPVQEGNNGIRLTQYPMGILEEIGLLKMDFLGLRNLTLLESILRQLERSGQKPVPLKDIPMDDEKTFRLLQDGKTTGIFQLETEGMTSVLKHLKPTDFEDIVAVNALNRPGPMANIPVYIERKHGKKMVSYPHPSLEPILKKTYGVIVYQEQIMQIASVMAGFTLGEADLLRRAVSKKKREILDQERVHFVNGALKKGYQKEVAENIYDLIVRFADYGFNRSHAVAYSMISYQLAYLKAHYPLAFMASLLTSAIGNEPKTAEYIREVQQMGYTVYAPSINKSGYLYEIEKDGIRFSLAAIKGVGIQALKEIIRARKDGPFKDLFDFCVRVSLRAVNRKTMEHLIFAGCFDEFGIDRATLLATLDVAIDHAQILKPEDTQFSIQLEESFHLQPKYVEVEPIPIEKKLNYEKQVLGFYLSKHPAQLYRNVFDYYGAQLIVDFPVNQRGSIGGYITDERKIRTKNGEPMSFLKISDESADIDAVCFPRTYKKYSSFLKPGELALFLGRMEFRNGNRQFNVEEVKPLGPLRESIQDMKVYIRVDTAVHDKAILLRLKELLEANKGKTEVLLYYARENRTLRLKEEQWINLESDCIPKIKVLMGPENVVMK